ncbi:MAG: LacI family DNA-binding transcriptional regulator [Chthoniobacteraceae bacterium]
MSSVRVTLRNVAQKAGVHVTTVSLALRNHASISVTTRERIQKIADEMGYRPDPMLSALCNYRRLASAAATPPTLAYLTEWRTREAWMSEEAHARIYAGACARAEHLGYAMEHLWLREPGMTTARWNKVLWTRNYGGLIIAPLPVGRGHSCLDWDRFSAIRIDPSMVRPRLHSVGNNQYQCMQIAFREARSRGYRRIGFAIKKLNNERVDLLWSAGMLTEQARHRDMECIPLLITARWGPEAFKEWFLRYRPDVVLSTHRKALDWITELGIRVPKDAGFIDLDCMVSNGVRAGVSQNHANVGAAAVDNLIRMIQQNERGIPSVPQTIYLDGAWVDGKTVRAIPAKTRRFDKSGGEKFI